MDTNKPIGRKTPATAMRFIILRDMSNETDLEWYFNSGTGDHAAMEEEYVKLNGNKWRAECGGFYTIMRNDLNQEIVDGLYVHTLNLFDISSTFGIYPETIKEAMPKLIKALPSNMKVAQSYYDEADTATVAPCPECGIYNDQHLAECSKNPHN